MTDVYEFSEYNRNNLVYNFVTLTPREIEEKKDNYSKLEAEKLAQKAAAAAKAAAEKTAVPKAEPKKETKPPEASGSVN
jgi:NADH-quinone oxidoreductase subunit I